MTPRPTKPDRRRPSANPRVAPRSSASASKAVRPPEGGIPTPSDPKSRASRAATKAANAPKSKPRARRFVTTIGLSPGLFQFLEERGGRSDRGKGTFNRSSLLRRKVDLLAALFERANPFETGRLPEEAFDLLCRLIPEPWTLTPDEIGFLEHTLAQRPNLARLAAEHSLDPKAFLASLTELDYAERMTLVDLLERKLGPAAPDR